MMNHWNQDIELCQRYGRIDDDLDALRPIAFLMATNRPFNLVNFYFTLEQSLHGSKLLRNAINNKLLHLYLCCPADDKPRVLNKHRKWIRSSWFDFNESERNNISMVRQMQNMLAQTACSELDDPILVVMDDDLSFEVLLQNDNNINTGYPFSYVHEIYAFQSEQVCDIALGGVTGSPPLPGTSSQRSFLQDFLANKKSSNTCPSRWNEPDYYYDLSDIRNSWKSWPHLTDWSTCEQPVELALNEMFHTGSSSRPLVYQKSSTPPQSRIVRGGNTVIYSTKFLREIPHPNIRRRGDSLWTILASENGAKILDFPYPLYHRRDELTYTESGLVQRMIDDLYGASIQRTMVQPSGNFKTIYGQRLEQQLSLLKDSKNLLLDAVSYCDNGTEPCGFWALNGREKKSFVSKSITLLDMLSKAIIHEKSKIDASQEWVEHFIKAIRYDAKMELGVFQ